MLPATLTLGAAIYTKISEDAQTGTLYRDLASDPIYPSVIVVNHQTPKIGQKSGTVRHLVSIKIPMLDGTSTADGTYVTANLTVTHPPHLDSGDAVVTTAQYLGGCLFSNATTFTANSSLITAWLQGQY